MRQHLALRRTGVDSRMYFDVGESMDSNMIPAFQNRSFLRRNIMALASYWQRRREAQGGVLFSPRWVRRTSLRALCEMPTVVNLHWVSKWLDLPSFFGSLPQEFPVVWTIRDLIPITGGCGYPGECERFTQECGNCPQLKSPCPQDASHRFFRAKAQLYQQANLHFVGNSEWTTAQIRRSGLGKLARTIRTIHNGLDPQEYQPVEKSVARKALGVPEGRFVIGFACLDFHEKRKGAAILMEALKSFPSREIVLLILGAGKWPESGVDTITLGSVRSPRLQSVFYSALDVFAMPSMAETFGNTTLEAMACQTPVVAYPAGGVADVVVDGETGLMDSEIGSVAGLVRMLRSMWKHPAERVAMGIAGRQRAITTFSDTLMGRRYAEMYEELVSV